MSKLLNAKAAAEYVGLTPWQVRSLAWDCQIPRVVVGRRHYFAVEDLDKWVHESREYAGARTNARTQRASVSTERN